MGSQSYLRHGIVREVDGKRGLARVEFQDQDGVASWWLSVVQPLASGSASRAYAMPEIGSQVACQTDERGEEGIVVGAVYSDKDQPPVSDPNHIHLDLGGGFSLDIDKAGQKIAINAPAGTTIASGDSSYRIGPDGITLDAAQFTVNAPTTFTQGFSASGGATTAQILGSIKISQRVEAGQEVSAPVLRGKVTG